MSQYRFDEVLNDLMDYFILGDPDYLLQYKIENQLPDDLLTEFTTQETGDRVVELGVLLPIAGIENHPYTIFFTLPENAPELLKPGNQVLHHCNGYCLRVATGQIFLYTIPYLRDFTETTLAKLKKYKHATIAIPNGWYTVTVLGGFTKQVIEIPGNKDEPVVFESMEPSFEFVITPAAAQPVYAANLNYRFTIDA